MNIDYHDMTSIARKALAGLEGYYVDIIRYDSHPVGGKVLSVDGDRLTIEDRTNSGVPEKVGLSNIRSVHLV